MSKFKLSLKLSNIGYLHFYEENEDVLKEKLDSVLGLRNAIASKLEIETKNMQTPAMASSDFPTIGQPSSQYDAILRVVNTDWARMQPRGLNEIHAALGMNAIHIDKTTLASRLSTLTRQGKIHRVKRNGTYAYTATLGSKNTAD